jgi:hypothetical protein
MVPTVGSKSLKYDHEARLDVRVFLVHVVCDFIYGHLLTAIVVAEGFTS